MLPDTTVFVANVYCILILSVNEQIFILMLTLIHGVIEPIL